MELAVPNRKWIGVRASKSVASELKIQVGGHLDSARLNKMLLPGSHRLIVGSQELRRRRV